MCRSRCPPPPNSLESRNRRAARGFPEPKPMRSLREMLGEAKRRKLLALFTTNTTNPGGPFTKGFCTRPGGRFSYTKLPPGDEDGTSGWVVENPMVLWTLRTKSGDRSRETPQPTENESLPPNINRSAAQEGPAQHGRFYTPVPNGSAMHPGFEHRPGHPPRSNLFFLFVVSAKNKTPSWRILAIRLRAIWTVRGQAGREQGAPRAVARVASLEPR